MDARQEHGLQPGPEKAADARLYLKTTLCIAIAARLAVLYLVITRYPHAWLYGRGTELGVLAASLASGQGFNSPFGGSTGPTALLSPGYPAMVALIFHIFGIFSSASAIAIMTLQALFGILTVLVVANLTYRCFDARSANLSGTFWALSPPLLWLPTVFWETSLSTLLLVGMVALALPCRHRNISFLLPLMGTYCALAGLVNPALLPPLCGICAWTAFYTRRLWPPYSPMLGLLLFILIFAPWPLRNACVLHAFIPMRSTIGLELWMGNRPGATGFLDESVFPSLNKQENASYISRGEVEYMRDKSAAAKIYICTHPGAFIKLSAVRFIRFWIGTGSQGGSIAFLLHALTTTTLGFVGLWRLFRNQRYHLAILFLVPIVVFPLPYYITHAEFRYRLVIDPLLTILAAYAITDMGVRTQRVHHTPV